jgi:hypothetical protein
MHRGIGTSGMVVVIAGEVQELAATMHLKNQLPVAKHTWYCVRRCVAARSRKE